MVVIFSFFFWGGDTAAIKTTEEGDSRRNSILEIYKIFCLSYIALKDIRPCLAINKAVIKPEVFNAQGKTAIERGKGCPRR